MTRFNMNAVDRDEARQYLMARAHQVLADGFVLMSKDVEPLVENGVEWGCRVLLRGVGTTYQTVYTYAPHRRQGYTSDFLRGSEHPVLTVPDCNIEGYLNHIRVAFHMAARHVEWPEYRLISKYYDDKAAERSQVPYMNHIDEGLAVLRGIKASQDAQRAYCLHPMFQSDDDLHKNFCEIDAMVRDDRISPSVIALTLEYRNIANATLSRREIRGADDIHLSPIEEVNDMLRADKVQNRKDFLLHHARTHERRAALDRYFRLWLERLSVPETEFAFYFDRLQVGGRYVSLEDAGLALGA